MGSQHVVYASGTIREVWKTSSPLMISWLSVVLMAFVDRIYLGYYSKDALNSAVTACTLAMAFTYGVQLLCEMGGIFVSQYNGAQVFDKIGKIVWQVIWIGVFSTFFFIPLSFFGGSLLFADSTIGAMEKDYFSTLVFFGPFFGIIGAVSGFYIGRGCTYVITLTTFVANIVNAALDPLLIFGWEGFVPSMGVKGAALASGFSCLIQGVILFSCFMRVDNRKIFKTFDWQIDPEQLWQCLKIGFPTALFILLEFGGWGIFYSMMRDASAMHIHVAGICQSILILFVFFGVGLQKGIATIAGNLIGAQKTEHIPTLLRSGFYLVMGYFLLTCIPMIVFPDFAIDLFLHETDPALIQEIKPILRTGLICTCLYLVFDDLRFIFGGILLGAGDTFFLLVSGAVSVWLFLLIPSYVGIVTFQYSVEMSMGIWVFYSFCTFLVPVYRFYFGNWGMRKVIEV